MRVYTVFLVVLFSCQISTAQEPTSNKSDAKIYKKIDVFSKDRKFFKFMHKLIFRSVESEPAPIVTVKKKVRGISTNQNPYNLYQCKVIRNIKIETLDPFGYSIDDESYTPNNFFEKAGNAIHSKTKNWTIRNLLLFKKNQELDSLLIKESERIIRNQRFSRNVIIKPIAIENNKDSVDVYIRVLDTWSLIPTGAYTSTRANLDITERNLLGLGHQLEFDSKKRFTDNTNGYMAKYSINNFKNSFVNTSFSSETDFDKNTTKSISIDRPFYSIFARWAGGINYTYNNYFELIPNKESIVVINRFKKKTYNFWIGHSYKIFSGQSEFARTTNFTVTSSFNNSTYLEKTTSEFDQIGYYKSQKVYLGTIGISSQNYYQDKYLFRFGTIEDIPYGKVFSVTGGLQNREGFKRAYFGTRFSYGEYFKLGYFQGNFECGSFFNNGNTEQSTIKFEINYFTNLFSIGRWKFRQFLKPVIVLGNNRLDTSKDRLTLVDINGIPGFNSAPLSGTEKFLMTFQTQSYNPKNLYGFNLSPFINCTLGFLGDGGKKVFNNKMYSQIGVGVLISNNYLVFNSFQFSFSYYPSLPNDGTNILKTNSFQNSDIQYRDFQIAQPYIVPYQ